MNTIVIAALLVELYTEHVRAMSAIYDRQNVCRRFVADVPVTHCDRKVELQWICPVLIASWNVQLKCVLLCLPNRIPTTWPIECVLIVC